MSSENTSRLELTKLSASEKIDTPLYKKKTFDFTDYAYREAVNRLKFLLTEAYEPTKLATSIYYRRSGDDGKSEASDSQSVIERPSLTEVSKYFNHGTVSRYGGVGGTTLGTTSHGGNDMALTTAAGGRRYSMLNKDLGLGSPGLKPAVSMASLHPAPSVCSVSQNLEIAQPPPELLGFIEKQETYIEQLEKESQYCREELSTLLKKVKDVVSENEALTDRARSKALYQVDSSESEDLDLDRLRDKGKLSGPNIVFESRISELEAQLAQSQIDLKKLFNENEENKRKLVHGSSDANCTDVYRKQVENLQRDKQSLEESVRKLQLTIDQLKDSEASSFNKSQRSRDMIEQVAFERNQGEIEIRRLKDELERQHERVREVQHEMAKRIAEERSNAERRYTFQVDQLGGDLSSQWEQSTKLQLEVERMRRIESDYKREINQKNSQLDELKLELKNKTAIFMSDLNQASAEKQSLEQEITSLRLQLERAERQTKVEVSRLTAECTSLRQRLDRADADLLHSKRENLKLSDDIASLEKELTLGDLNKETRPSKELAKIIADMEAKHASTVSELEGMVQDQKQLMEKLTAECKSLTHKLEDTTLRHKDEKKELRQTNNELMERLKQLWTNYKEISPVFQKRKCSADHLESDSNLSTGSNHEPAQAPKAYPDRVAQPQTIQHPDLCSQTKTPQSVHRLTQQKHHGLTHNHQTDNNTQAQNSNHHQNCLETIRSPIMLQTPKATSTPMKNEVTPASHEHRYPMRTLPRSCKERSRSLDVLTQNEYREPATTSLNQTAPAAVDACLENRYGAVNEHLDSRLDTPNQSMDQKPRTSINHQPPSIPTPHNRQIWINPMHNPQISNTNSLTKGTTRMPGMTTHSMIPHSSTTRVSMTQQDTQTSNTYRNHTTSKPTITNSTRIINNHMMHSSTPLSKYMMNPVTPLEAHSPQHSNNNNNSHSHRLHQHHYPQPHPSHWNKMKAIEMWATHGQVEDQHQTRTQPPVAQTTERSNLNTNQQQEQLISNPPGCYSLPRQLPESCHFKPIDSYPSLSISSPSLFNTSPETSLTPSPTTTVLNNYNSASPNL
ncbi:uncharacterized protein LOC129747746 isoform X3 [Uranotaenia lowii]|uniref:uncharacterized protein LOC129747746 isoform X3 n=1 Tax=Uranotaenia lowii TaxID=190385 RepID=UPI002479467E|nr:uncharacterized protein LOC129747746 isoform X3 [Uranotaenia lowii]